MTVLFQTELIMNTHVTVSDMHHDVSGIRRDVSKIQEDIGNQVRSVCIKSIGYRRMLTVT